jgi:hypothetical protein
MPGSIQEGVGCGPCLLECPVESSWEDLPATAFPCLVAILPANACAQAQLSCRSWYLKIGPAVTELAPSKLHPQTLVDRFPNITALDLRKCTKYTECSLILLIKLRKLAKIWLANSESYLQSSLGFPGACCLL